MPSKRITVPASTPEGAPVEEEIILLDRRLLQVLVSFPRNQARLCGVQVELHGERIVPRLGGDKWVYGDGNEVIFNFGEGLELQSPAAVVIRAYSDDDTYVRRPTVEFEVA